MNDALRWLMRDVIEDEMHKGELKGEKAGELKGEQRVNRLNEQLMDDNRLEDMKRAVKDPAYQKQLMREYGILPVSAS